MKNAFIHRALAALLVVASSAAAFAQSPTQFKHVVVVALENHSYDKVIGNANMPFVNDLADKYGLAKGFYATTHPSIPNYFRLTTGQTITTDDAYTGTVSSDNIVRELNARGLSWKSYAESLPYAGYMGGDVSPYAKRHNPFVYFSDVKNSSTQRDRVVPFTEFSSDLSAGHLPAFSFIVPNEYHDAHSCPGGGSTCPDEAKLIAADQWLQTYIAPLLDNAEFQKDGLLVIWFDEGDESDTTNGGGHTAVILAGNGVRPGYQSTTMLRHEGLLRSFADIFSFGTKPGASATATSLDTFFRAFPTSTTTTTSSTSGAVAGKIMNARTGGAVSGATVTIAGHTTRSSSTGAYSVSGIAPGTYAMAVSSSGYLPRSVSTTIASGATSSASVPIATAGKIKGVVVNSSGTAISGAQLVFIGGVVKTSFTLKSSSSGYATPYIPVGSYTIIVSASGHTTKTVSTTVNTGATTTLKVTLY